MAASTALPPFLRTLEPISVDKKCGETITSFIVIIIRIFFYIFPFESYLYKLNNYMIIKQ